MDIPMVKRGVESKLFVIKTGRDAVDYFQIQYHNAFSFKRGDNKINQHYVLAN